MSRRPPASRFDTAAFAAAVVVNLVVLYWPRAVSEGGIPNIDKVVHILVFGAVAWTGARAGLPVRWLVPVLVLHAVSSELVQHYLLPARSGDPVDAVADVLGVVAGVAVARGGGSWGHGGAGGRDSPDRAVAHRDADAG
jgi:VanZ family protein